jgi:hypothetical protein
MADRQITWSLATLFRTGAYNSTFAFDVIQPAFDLTCRYFQLSMPRVRSGGQIRVIQSNVNKNGWAAWTTGNTIYISPVFDFGMNRRRCSKVVVHEFGHIGNGTSHSRDPQALMAADGGTSQGWVQDDLRWFGRYRLRGAMPPQGIFATAFEPTASFRLMLRSPSFQEMNYTEEKMPLGVANSIWDRFLNFVRPTYSTKEGVTI